MTTLVIGATGMLGREILAEAKARGLAPVGAARKGADIALDIAEPGAAEAAIARLGPRLVINAAALISHRACEERPDLAYAVNARAVAFIADACRAHRSRLVHVSTDHFFTGDGRTRHDEDAPVRLVSEYARSKFAGEAFALTLPGALVLRTNVTGFRGEPNLESFIEWACRSIEADAEMDLFDDYVTSTFSTRQFARAALDLAAKGAAGRINLAAREPASKKEFVESLAGRLGRRLSRARTRSVHEVLPGRADSCGLDVGRAEGLLGYRLPTLADVTAALAAEYRARRPG